MVRILRILIQGFGQVFYFNARSDFTNIRTENGRADLRLDRPAERHLPRREGFKQIALDQTQRCEVAKPAPGEQTAPSA